MRNLPRETEKNSHSAIGAENVPAAARYFDYGAAVALRNLAAAFGTAMPRYLLAPEVAILLSHEPDLKKRLLIDTFWNTGGRLNEVLPLTAEDFALDGPDGRPLLSPFVVLHTLKQRSILSATRRRGRPTREEQSALREAEANPPRALPLTDPATCSACGNTSPPSAEKGRAPLGREQPRHRAHLDTPGGDRRPARRGHVHSAADNHEDFPGLVCDAPCPARGAEESDSGDDGA